MEWSEWNGMEWDGMKWNEDLPRLSRLEWMLSEMR